jgi:hypothetical protein
MWRTILDVIPSLDRDCQIQANTRWRRHCSYLCITCGRHLDDSFEAALHQLGGDAVPLLASIHPSWDDSERRARTDQGGPGPEPVQLAVEMASRHRDEVRPGKPPD